MGADKSSKEVTMMENILEKGPTSPDSTQLTTPHHNPPETWHDLAHRCTLTTYITCILYWTELLLMRYVLPSPVVGVMRYFVPYGGCICDFPSSSIMFWFIQFQCVKDWVHGREICLTVYARWIKALVGLVVRGCGWLVRSRAGAEKGLGGDWVVVLKSEVV